MLCVNIVKKEKKIFKNFCYPISYINLFIHKIIIHEILLFSLSQNNFSNLIKYDSLFRQFKTTEKSWGIYLVPWNEYFLSLGKILFYIIIHLFLDATKRYTEFHCKFFILVWFSYFYLWTLLRSNYCMIISEYF